MQEIILKLQLNSYNKRKQFKHKQRDKFFSYAKLMTPTHKRQL